MKRNIFGVVVIIIVVLGFWYFMDTDTPEEVPENGLTYIKVAEPVVTETVTRPFACAPDGEATELRRIEDSLYCVHIASEGAAGSVYHTFTYDTPAGSATDSTTFTLRYVQCTNYDEPKQSACMEEQDTFSPDSLVIN